MTELSTIDKLDIRTILILRKNELQQKLKKCQLSSQRNFIIQLDRINQLLAKLEN